MASIVSKVAVLASAVLLLAASAPAGLRGTVTAQDDPSQSRDAPSVTLSADLVEVLVTVVDSRGRPVRGLRATNFEVFDEGARQEIDYFSDQNGPLSLGVVFDMTGTPRDAAEQILTALRGSRLVTELAAEVSFIALNEKAYVAMGFVGTAEQVVPELQFADPFGPLSVREALACVQGGLRAPRGSRTVVLLITDGGASVGARGIANCVEAGQAELFAVFPSNAGLEGRHGAAGATEGSQPWQWWRSYSFDAAAQSLNRAAVAGMARRSGGRALYAFEGGGSSLDELFDSVGEVARGQYAITFYPTSNRPGWHRIVVRLTPEDAAKGLSVSHRAGYRALG